MRNSDVYSLTPLLLPAWIKELLILSAAECERITADKAVRHHIREQCIFLAESAFKDKRFDALRSLHQCLHIIHAYEFSEVSLDQTEADPQPILKDITHILEKAMLSYEYSLIPTEIINECPSNGVDYIKWLKNLIAKHPSNAHSFYREFLRDHATSDEMRFYLAQETNLDPRFDDILALLQIGTHGQTKMEIASNYWDEMGNGVDENVHTSLFAKALDVLNVDHQYINSNMLDEAIISGNLSSCLSLNRRHYHKAIGYFGVTEYSTPSRFKHFVKGWERNNLPKVGISYHKLHVTIDTVHGNSWFNKVIAPAVDQNPLAGKEMAIGALVRLNSSERYLTAMLNHLMLQRLQIAQDFDTGCDVVKNSDVRQG